MLFPLLYQQASSHLFGFCPLGSPYIPLSWLDNQDHVLENHVSFTMSLCDKHHELELRSYIQTPVFVVVFDIYPSAVAIAESKGALNYSCVLFRITSEAEYADSGDCFIKINRSLHLCSLNLLW